MEEKKCLILVTFHQTKKSDTLGVKSSFKNRVVSRALCRKWSSVAATEKLTGLSTIPISLQYWGEKNANKCLERG